MSADHAPTTPRVAVIGCGVWGRNHVRNYAEIGSLAAVSDRNAGAAAIGEHHGVPARTIDAILADRDIDAVVLALPPSQNLPVGLAALSAGKHLFVEKPMALTTVAAAALLDAAAAADRRLMVGHILQYHPAFRSLVGLVEAGRLGILRRIVSTRLDFGRIRREEDALWALAPHDISMVLALAGAEPETVVASGGHHTHPDIADTAGLELGFRSGLVAEIRVSWLHPVKEQRLVAIGSRAMAVFDDREDWPRKLVLYDHKLQPGRSAPLAVRGEPVPVSLAPAEPLRAECLHFLDCIRTGDDPITDGREGRRVIAVLERASAALRREGVFGPDRAPAVDTSA